jgi:hypothetical protein
MPILKVQTNAKLVRKGLEDLKAEIPKISRARMYSALLRAQQRLKRPGKKPKYPIPWDSIRQRKAFFASDGFDGGIPHLRRGLYQKAFRIRRLSAGHELSNMSKGAKYIGGDARGKRWSRIHEGTHPLVRDEVDKEVAKLPSAVVEHLKTVARQKGFQTR